MAVVVFLAPAAAFGQKKGSDERNSQSAALVQELKQLLEAKQLTNVAAPNGDTYVGAYYIPGRQLLVVSGKLPGEEWTQRIRYHLAAKNYSDAYTELNGATTQDSRVLISDLGADGLRFDREKDQPFDYVDLAGKSVQFDGQWGRDRGITKDEYAETWQQTDERYTRMLEALIATLKKSS